MDPGISILDWKQPLLAEATRRLMERAVRAAAHALDLSHVAVVVPTRQAGRRLREALAQAASQRRALLLPPTVFTTADMLRPSTPSQVATPTERLLTWIGVLRETDPGAYPALFPTPPRSRGMEWALPLARSLIDLQDQLLEANLDPPGLADRLEDFPNPQRRMNLAALHQRYLAKLDDRALEDPLDVARRAMESGSVLAPFKQRVLIGIYDLNPIHIRALETLPDGSVELWLQGPTEAIRAFDRWGHPNPAFWEPRALRLSACIRCRDSREQAAQIFQALDRLPPEQEKPIAVGVLDSSFASYLERRSRHHGIPCFNPAGRDFHSHALSGFLRILGNLAGRIQVADALAFLRHPVGTALLQDRGVPFHLTRALAAIDRLYQDHLPETLEDLGRHNRCEDVSACIQLLNTVSREFRELPDGAAFLSWMDKLVRPTWRDLAAEDRESVKAFAEALEAPALACFREPGLNPADRVMLLLEALRAQREYPRREPGSIDLPGWLELPWDPAPMLVLTDCNHEILPAPARPDPFLSEAERGALGLATYETRWIRDRFLLECLGVSRPDGALVILVPQSDGEGEPRQPSSLLLRCEPEELPERIGQLFEPLPPAAAAPPWRAAWKWAVPAPAPAAPEGIPVTAFGAYLNCPFRYYLERECGMSAIDPDKMEWDALDFGSMAHTVLEAWGKEPAMCRCNNPERLAAWLAECLAGYVHSRYGRTLPLPVHIQMESLEQRLRAFAHEQVTQLEAGWEMVEVEYRLHEPPPGPVLEGYGIRGVVDRIERHRDTGKVRIVDYKTGDKAADPEGAHLRNWGTRDERCPPPDYAVIHAPDLKKPMVWTNLQLPLYAWALQQKGVAESVEVAYFNLPKALSETGIRSWNPDAFEARNAAALACARGVLRDIGSRRFWPPREPGFRDPFESIFFKDIEARVDAGALEAFLNGRASP